MPKDAPPIASLRQKEVTGSGERIRMATNDSRLSAASFTIPCPGGDLPTMRGVRTFAGSHRCKVFPGGRGRHKSSPQTRASQLTNVILSFAKDPPAPQRRSLLGLPGHLISGKVGRPGDAISMRSIDGDPPAEPRGREAKQGLTRASPCFALDEGSWARGAALTPPRRHPRCRGIGGRGG